MSGYGWVWWSWNLGADLRDMLQYEFIRNALEAGTIIAIVAGVVSYLVVLRRSSFAAHALGHIGFSGAAGAVLFAVAPIYGLLLATTVSGAAMAVLGKTAATRDVEIGTVLAFVLALGLLFLSFYKGYATEAYSILFGEIVGISSSQVVFTLEASIPVMVVLGLVYRQLLFASLDEEVAEAKGMHTVLLGVIFMVSLAVAISIAVTIIGVLLIFALTVTPAAIAIRLATRPLRGDPLRAHRAGCHVGRNLHRVLRDRTHEFLHRNDRLRGVRTRAHRPAHSASIQAVVSGTDAGARPHEFSSWAGGAVGWFCG